MQKLAKGQDFEGGKHMGGGRLSRLVDTPLIVYMLSYEMKSCTCDPLPLWLVDYTTIIGEYYGHNKIPSPTTTTPTNYGWILDFDTGVQACMNIFF